MLLFNTANDTTGLSQSLLETVHIIKNDPAINQIQKDNRPAVAFAIANSRGNTRRHTDIQAYSGLYVFDLDQYPDPNLSESEQELKLQPDSTVDTF